jgi:hypothetical protein
VVASVSQDVMTAIQVSGAPPTLKYSTDGSVIELNVGEVSMTGKQEPLLGRTLLVSAGVPPVLRPVDDEKYVVPALSCQSSGVMVKFASSTEAARLVCLRRGFLLCCPVRFTLCVQISGRQW